MKKTLNVNVGGQGFTLDEDAYETLRDYLAEIEIRLDGLDKGEVMEDIETRVADIFSENLSTRVQVVGVEVVRRAMAILGPAREFGEPRRTATAQAVPQEAPHRFLRSSSDKIIGGVCGGIATYYNFDPLLVRILTAVITFAFGGIPVAVYLALWALMPQEEKENKQ